MTRVEWLLTCSQMRGFCSILNLTSKSFSLARRLACCVVYRNQNLSSSSGFGETGFQYFCITKIVRAILSNFWLQKNPSISLLRKRVKLESMIVLAHLIFFTSFHLVLKFYFFANSTQREKKNPVLTNIEAWVRK